MDPITDAFMREMLGKGKGYCLVLVSAGPSYQDRDARSPEQAKLIWEHGRRNFELRQKGQIALVGPVSDAPPVVGLSVFTVPADEVRALMEADPAVRAGVLTYRIASWFSFPGDGLPV